MTAFNRREFLDRSTRIGLGWSAGSTILANAQSVWATPANNKVTLGFIGAGGRGSQLLDAFLDRSDCQVAWVADVDLPRAEAVATAAEKKGGKRPKAVQDFRKVLDDKTFDAVVIATPDHWHALATIWACQAGKDVYVEKPPTYNCWEGRKMIEAARKYQRITRPKLHEGVVKDQKKGRFPDPEHKENFLDCVRTRKTPNADIEEGHRSTLLSHLANISYRLGGQKLIIDAKTERIVGNDEAMKFYRREYRKPYVIEENV